MVARGLNYHFCSPPEFFTVESDLPFIFTSSVAANIVKNHLVKRGISAIDGAIFRIHAERQAAINDVIKTVANRKMVPNSNFEIGGALQAQLRPTPQPSNLSDHCTISLLDGNTQGASSCLLHDDHSKPGVNSAVKSTLSISPLRAGSVPKFLAK
jgi:hypothetical protein